MAEMLIVEDRNQDDLSRKAGCYLYVDTELWLDGGLIHRADGPAIVFPDGATRWYSGGKEVTREVTTFFIEQRWPILAGLDTLEKRLLFSAWFQSRESSAAC
jgi:hypothetical protein